MHLNRDDHIQNVEDEVASKCGKQSTPVDNTQKGVWQYIEKEERLDRKCSFVVVSSDIRSEITFFSSAGASR